MKTFLIKAIITFCLLCLPPACQNLFSQAYANIPIINKSITIDGIIDTVWEQVIEVDVTSLIVGTIKPDSSDCSGYFKAFLNDSLLYVMIQALDDTLYTSDPVVYENDGFEIYLDVENLKEDEYSDHCYQFRFIPGNTEITGRWGLNVWTPPTVDFAIKVDTGKGRTIEAVFPLIELGRVSPLNDGQKIGFEVEILDNDGAGRDYVLSWNKNDHMAWYTPSKMGTLEFDGLTALVDQEAQLIKIYPNPATDLMSVESDKAIKTWSLLTTQGQLITCSNLVQATKFSINLGNLDHGLYILKTTDISGNQSSYKILKK